MYIDVVGVMVKGGINVITVGKVRRIDHDLLTCHRLLRHV